MAEQYTAGQLLVPVKPDARGAATRVRREFESMREPTVRIDVDIRDLEKKIGAEQAKLDKLQQRKVSPKLDLDIAEMNAKLAQARARLEELQRKPASAKVDADIAAAEVKVARISHSLDVLNRAKADPKIDLDIANADAKLAGMRARLDQLRAERADVKVDADTGGAMLTLTNFRAFASRAVGTVQSRVDVDTSGAIVQLAALSRALGTLTMPAAIIGATPFLASLGDSARDAAGAAWLLPAAMSAGAISIGALKTATAGVGDAMKYAFDPEQAEKFAEALAKLSPQAQATVLSVQALAPQLTAVRTASQDALFQGLGPLVDRLADPYLPMAETTFARIASSVNAGAHAFGNYLTSSAGIGQVSIIADGTAVAFDNVFAAVSPLGQAFVNVAAIGMPVLVQLTGGAEGVAQRFAAWTSSAQGINTITMWIWNAIHTLQQLWQLAVNVGSILSSVFDAGAASGESFLGVLVRITGSLAAALNTPEGSAQLTEFFTVVRGLAQGFVDKLVILWPAVVAFAQALGNVLIHAGPLVEVMLQLAVWALVPLLNVISALSPILGPMVGVYIAMRVATAAWAAVQWLLNAALTANPIGLVILAVTALVAAVIYAYQNFEWFRNIVDAAWRGISAAAQWAWTNILQPVFSAIWGWVQNTLGPAVLWLWNNVFVPAWNAIAAVVGWAWTNIIQPYWQGLWAAAQLIGQAVMWLWTNVFVPAWNAIAAVVQWAWVNIIQPVWNAIDLVARYIAAVVLTVLLVAFRLAWEGISAVVSFVWNTILLPIWNALVAFVQTILVPVITWLWQNVFVPAWNGIGAAVSFVWNTILLPIWNALVFFVNGIMIPAIMWLWNNVFVPAWNGIGFVISTVWNTIILPIWNGLVFFVNGIMIPAIMWLWNNVMVPAWNGIAFVIQTVWNTLILPVWNALVGFINSIIIPAMNFLWHNVVVPVWNGIGSTIQWVWENVIRPAWDAVSGGLRWLGDNFQAAVDRIGQVWNGLRRMLAAPVNFLINTVWNNGIVKAWNEVSRLVGLPAIAPLAGIPEYASGGIYRPDRYTPGRDIGYAALSGGEAVMRPEWTRAVGADYVAQANAAARHGGRAGVDAFLSGAPASSAHAREEGRAKLGLMRRYPLDNGGPAGPYAGAWAYGGVQPHVARAGQEVERIFGPMPGGIGGVGARANASDHPKGLALDFMTLGNVGLGNRVSQHFERDAGRLAVKYIIWQQRINSGSGWRGMEDRGSPTANHMDHPHVSFNLSPTGGGGFAGGGAGGPAPVVDTISPAIEEAYRRHADPVVRRFNQDNEIGSTGRINPNRRMPPGYGTLDRDETKKRLLAEAQKVIAAQAAAGGGGGAMGATSNEAPGIVRIISDVARGRFGAQARQAADIGVSVGLVESNLRNITRAVDHDSLGVFQQRPSMGWGTPAQLTNVSYAAGAFFSRFPGNWASQDPGTLAANIQRPAAQYRGRYGQRMGQARSLVAQHGGFHDGGLAPRGAGIMLKTAIPPERVLDPAETRQYDTLGPLVREMEAGRVPSASSSREALLAARASGGDGLSLSGMRIEGSVEVNGLEGHMKGVVVDTLEDIGRAHQRGIRSSR